jgi:predicted transposase/invertase (TIGR01784 family)
MYRLNPRVDFAFKKLFGSEENSDILKSFVNAVLPPDDQVTTLELKNPYTLKDFATDKMSILDIRAVDTSGRTITIEMQITDQLHYEKRALFLWSDVYAKQLQIGQDYCELKKTIAIHVLNFNLMDEDSYHNVYRIKNTVSNNPAFGDFQLHTIELKKFQTDIHHLKTSLDRWVLFLTKAHEYSKTQVPDELKPYKEIEKAITVLDTLYLDETERAMYEAQLKWLRDREASIQRAFVRGEEKGRLEAEHKAKTNILTIAKTLKQSGFDNEAILAMTGLAPSEL